MFDGIDPSIDDFDDLVKDDESRLRSCEINLVSPCRKHYLEAGKFHQGLDCSCVGLPTPLNLLTAFSEPGQAEIIVLVLGIALELG